MQALLKAISENDSARFRSILESDPRAVNAKADNGASAILFAVYCGRLALAKELIKAGGTVGIHEAAAMGDLERVRAILEDDPRKVNSFSGDGFQPLGLAAFFGHAKVGEYLLSHGADPASPSRNYQKVAPLHSAAASRNHSLVDALIEKGVDVNAWQQGGYTALHAAIQNKDAHTAEALIKNGADCGAENERGERPVDLLDDAGRKILGDLLQSCE